MGITASDRNYGAISMAHSYGFSNLVTPLIIHGIPLVITNDRFPRSLLRGLTHSGATVFPGTPFFFRQLADLPLPDKFPHLRLCISAGSILPLETIQSFHALTGLKIHTFYGSSECGGITYDASTSLELQPGYIGTPLNQVTLHVDSDSNRPFIQSNAVAEGYFPLPQPDILGNGIFHPSDLLEPLGKGFRITGRVSDLINIAGRKLNPLHVERVLNSFPEVQQSVVFGIPDPIRGESPFACVVLKQATSETRLLSLCRECLPDWQTPRKIHFLETIPLTPRGKISRVALARLFGEASGNT